MSTEDFAATRQSVIDAQDVCEDMLAFGATEYAYVPGRFELPIDGPVTDLTVVEGVMYATVGKSVFAAKDSGWVLAFTL